MKIHLRNLRANTLLGVYDFERAALREVVLNIEIEIEDVHSDAITDTLDYAALEEAIITSAATQQFQLIESLTVHVAKLVLKHRQALAVTVMIDKPGALNHAESVAVSYTLKRPL